MLRIALSTLAARKSGMLGAFAAVALAVVLVVSCGILLESSLRAPIRVERLAAAGVVVAGRHRRSAASGDRRHLPAGARAPAGRPPRRECERVPRRRDRPSPTARSTRARRSHAACARPDAMACRSSATAGRALRSRRSRSRAAARRTLPPRSCSTDDFAAHAAISLGDRVRDRDRDARGRFTVVGIAALEPPPAGARDAGLLPRRRRRAPRPGAATRPTCSASSSSRGADAASSPPASAASRAAQGLRVLTGAQRGEAESPDDALSREDTVAGLTVFALLAAFVALFVVASTFALSVQQRHRELALFRAIGCTPRQVRRMVAGEALLVAHRGDASSPLRSPCSPRASSRARSRAPAWCPRACISPSAGSRSSPASALRS